MIHIFVGSRTTSEEGEMTKKGGLLQAFWEISGIRVPNSERVNAPGFLEAMAESLWENLLR